MINNKSSNSDYLLTELERTKIETINYTSATGTVTIPSGLPVGSKKLIRKINSTQGTVTINCTGETFTPSNLSSVTLNSDGDFWLIEKVSNTRWDLVDGMEYVSTSASYTSRSFDGTQVIKCIRQFEVVPASTFKTVSVVFERPFINTTYTPQWCVRTNVPGSNQSEVSKFLNNGCWVSLVSTTSFGYETYAYVSVVNLPVQIDIVVTGKWY